jgi:hypothetical protein
MMTMHGPLLRIDVRHGFYADGTCPGLRLLPTPATRALVDRAGGLVRATGTGIELWLDERTAADWLDAGPGDALAWLMVLDDPSLDDHTAGLGRPREELAYFDAFHAVLDTPTGYWRLHAGDVASAREVLSTQAACARAGLDPLELRGAARALVCVPKRACAATADDCTRYMIRFAPRETVWKYCLVGEWPEPALQVVDLARQVAFEPAPPHDLADGRRAVAFRSKGSVALQQLPRERFQLCSRGGDRGPAEKILVKRLPVAAPRHFSREVIDGVPALVSEIFVHR